MQGNTEKPTRRGEDGAVTAETAVLLPILVVLLIAGMWVVGVVLANVRCVDAARDAARAVARGETIQAATEVGSRAAPPGAEIRINRYGADVEVVVTAAVQLDWFLLNELPAIEVQGRSVIRVEPGVDAPAGFGIPVPARQAPPAWSAASQTRRGDANLGGFGVRQFASSVAARGRFGACQAETGVPGSALRNVGATDWSSARASPAEPVGGGQLDVPPSCDSAMAWSRSSVLARRGSRTPAGFVAPEKSS